MERIRNPKKLIIPLFIAAAFVVGLFHYISLREKTEDLNAVCVSGWPYNEYVEQSAPPEVISREGSCKFVIPDDLKEDTCLCFYLNEQSITGVLGSTVLFTRRCADSDQWFFVNLPENARGKTLLLFFGSSTSSSPGLLRSVYLGTQSDCLKLIKRQTLPGFLLCFAVFCIGLVLSILGLYGREAVEASLAVRHTGVMLLLLAIWGISNLPVLRLFLDDTTLVRFCGMTGIFLAPMEFAMVIKAASSENDSLHREAGYFQLLFSILTIACIILDLKGWYSLSATTSWVRILNGTFLIYLLAFGLLDPRYYRERKVSSIRNKTGILAFAVAVFFACFEAWFLAGSYLSVNPAVIWTVYAVCWIMLVAIFTFVLIQARTLVYLQQILEQSRMRLMLSQMKPHFMYNTLNSIRSLLRTDPKTADDLVLQLSRFLRSTIHSIGDKEMVPFSSELDLIKAYVGVETICYPRLKVEYDIGVVGFKVPPLSIQPLVENAIRHGVLKKPGEGTVILRTYDTPENTVIEVEDDGAGLTQESLEKKDSYGLNNISMRLDFFCHAKIDIESAKKEGTLVSIRIPKNQIVSERE